MCKVSVGDILEAGANVSTFGAYGAIKKKVLPDLPDLPVTKESPTKDQATIEAEAAALANQDVLKRRRRIRASSLMATGGLGDPSQPVLASPSATAKPTLGA